jgi:hypothetical protein
MGPRRGPECAILRAVTRFRRTLGLMGVLSFSACGGRAHDTTTILPEPPTATEPAAPTHSAAIEALAEPAARDAFCGWVGASAASVAGRAGQGLDCTQFVERCRAAAATMNVAAPANGALGLLGLPADLEGVLGCPVPFETVDACLAELIEWSVARYPDGPGCGMAAPIEPPGLQDLSQLPSCVVVAVDCPALLQQLLANRGSGG